MLFERYPVLRACEEQLRAAFDALAVAYRSGNKLLVCGNGGSAADSEHIVAELMKGFLKRRPIPAADAAKLEAAGGKGIAGSLQGTLAELARMLQVGVISGPAVRWKGELVILFRRLAG